MLKFTAVFQIPVGKKRSIVGIIGIVMTWKLYVTCWKLCLKAFSVH